MNEKPQEDHSPDTAREGNLLGKIPPGEFDTQLHPANTPASPAGPQTTGDQLELPPGALAAMRMSGGFVFSSQSVTIYHDGRIVAGREVGPGPIGVAPRGKLSSRDADELYRALQMANLPELSPAPSRPNPDAYAYELATRAGRVIYSVEFFEGSIPERVMPLIQFLSRFITQTV